MHISKQMSLVSPCRAVAPLHHQKPIVMKPPIITLFITVLFALSFDVSAQAPEQFNYQAVVRDQYGNVLANTSADFLITIRDGSPTGTDVYHESFSLTTNAYGLVNLSIGAGSNPSAPFSDIVWSSGAKYLEVQMDPGTGYIPLGVTQLLSVPYALYSNVSGNSLGQYGAAKTEFADFYAVIPYDNMDTIFGGERVAFGTRGVMNGNISRVNSADSLYEIILPSIGIYMVTFSVNVSGPGQLVLALNGNQLQYSAAGCHAGDMQINGMTMVGTSQVNSTLSLRNPIGSLPLLLQQANSGTLNTTAHIMIVRLF
jgi:hypothetical protein